MSLLRRRQRRNRPNQRDQSANAASTSSSPSPADDPVEAPQLASEMAEIELDSVQEQEDQEQLQAIEAEARDFGATESGSAAEVAIPRRGPVKQRSRSANPSRVRWGVLFSLLVLILIAVALLLNAQGLLPAEVLIWWPLALLIPGALWLLGSLVRRSGRGLLASAAVIGVGISLLLGTQEILPVGSTLVGIVLISVGTSILLRGLLMGRQPIAQ